MTFLNQWPKYPLELFDLFQHLYIPQDQQLVASVVIAKHEKLESSHPR